MKYQASTFASLLTNFDQVEEQLATAQNASGTASKELEKSLDSVTAKMNELNNTFTQTINNIVNSDGIKVVIDSLNVFASAIEKVSHSLGGIGTILLGGGIIKAIKDFNSTLASINAGNTIKGIGGINEANIKQVEVALQGLTVKEQEAALATAELTEAEALLIKENLGLEASTKKTSLSMTSFKEKASATGASVKSSLSTIGTAIKGIGKTVAIFAILEVAMLGFSKIKDAWHNAHLSIEELNESLEDSINTYKEVADSISSMNDKLKTNHDRIKELQALEKNGGITVEEEYELENLKKQNEQLERKIANEKILQENNAKKMLGEAQKNTPDADDMYKDINSMNGSVNMFGQHMSGKGLITDAKDEAEAIKDLMAYMKGVDVTSSLYSKLNDYFEDYMESLNNQIEAYEILEDSENGLSEADKKRYEECLKINEAIQKQSYWLNESVTGYNALNEEEKKLAIQTKLRLSINKQGNGLVKDSELKAITDNMSDEQINSFAEKAIIPDYSKFDKSITEDFAKEYISAMYESIEDKAEKEGEKTSKATIKALWSDYSSDNDFKSVTKEIEKLASAGELTPQTLSSTKEYNALLKEMGVSAQQLSDYIHSTMSDTEQMNAFAKAMGSISTAYEQFKSKGSNTTSTLSGLEGAFGNLNSFKEFTNIVGDASSSTAQMQNAYNKLIDEYVSSTGILDTITESNKGYIETQLKALGIQNAETIVSDVLNGKLLTMADTKRIMKKYNLDLVKSSASEIASLSAEGKESAKTADALLKLAVKKQGVNKTTITTDGDISNLVALAVAGSKTAQILLAIATVKEKLEKGTGEAGTAGGRKVLEAQLKNLENQLKSIAKGGNRANSILSSTADALDKQSKSTSTANKGWSKFSQTIDWASKTVSMLTSKISLLNAKLGNTTNVSKQISAYNELIKAQKKLIEGYTKSESTYSKQYKKALKKLSKKDRKKVEDGTYTVEKFKGKAKSGKTSAEEKRYNQIIKALNARDNWLSAKTNIENAIKQLNEYAEALASIKWDAATKKVDKLNNKIDILDKKMASVNSYADKNDMLKEQLDLQKQIVDEQEKAYKSDKKKKNTFYGKIKSKYKKKKDSDGYISTDGITDAKQLEYITKYNAYLKAMKEHQDEVNKAKAEYNNLVLQAKVIEAENIEQYYNNKLQASSQRVTELNNEISLITSKGMVESIDYYKQLAQISDERKLLLEGERASLMAQLNSTQENTTQWYELQQKVFDVDNAIAEESANAVENINKQIEATKTLVSTTNDYLDSVNLGMTTFRDYAKDDIFGDDGAITDVGYAYIASLNSSKAIAKNKQTNAMDTMNSVENAYRNGDITQAKYLTDLEAARKEYIDSWKEEQDIIKEQQQLVVDYYSSQKDNLQEIVDLKKEALEADKSEYEYQKSIAEKTKSITDLEKQLAMLNGNDSEEANAQRQSLQEQLKEARQDLSDTQYDKYIERQEKFMDDIITDFEDMIENYEKNKADALATIIELMSNGSYGTIVSGVDQVVGNSNVISSDGMSLITSNGDASLASFINKDAQDSYSDNTTDNTTEDSEMLSAIKEFVTSHPKKIDASKSSDLNKYIYEKYGYGISRKNMTKLANMLVDDYGIDKGMFTLTKDGVLDNASKTRLLNLLKGAGFSSGGIVSDIMSVVKTNGDDGIATLKRGEAILTSSQALDFKKLANNLDILNRYVDVSRFKSGDYSSIGGSSTNVDSVTFNFALENVANADDMIEQIKSSTKLQKALQNATVGQMTGTSKFKVNRL